MEESRDLYLENLDDLIVGCISGNRHAQNRLYELFASRMLMVCLRYASNRDEAEEALQEGFIRIFTHISQYRHTGSFEGWIRKIMVNVSLQRYRDRTRLYPIVNLEDEHTTHASANETLSKLGVKDLINLVQKLPPAYRLVFNLYVFEGLKHREIAELLGISEGTSKSNLSDARNILQKEVIKLNQIYDQKQKFL
jgi:RNA polymerase sigma-70 factor (ECF subfamily)